MFGVTAVRVLLLRDRRGRVGEARAQRALADCSADRVGWTATISGAAAISAAALAVFRIAGLSV
jgi:hypothetical protein